MVQIPGSECQGRGRKNAETSLPGERESHGPEGDATLPAPVLPGSWSARVTTNTTDMGIKIAR